MAKGLANSYGGCTAALTAALESTRIIEDENLLDNSVKVGTYLNEQLEKLRKYDIVGDIRGKGLFAGIEFITDRATKEPISEGQMAQLMGNVMAQNVIVGRTNSSFHGLNNIMNFAPCLIITKEQVDTIVAAVTTAIKKTFKY
jgi:taurine-pyruvate aminotransferase